jgi:hypothetical protein
MRKSFQAHFLSAVLSLGVLLNVACAPDKIGISPWQIGETDTSEPTRADQDCRQCLPDYLKATLESIPPVSSAVANPLSPVMTAVQNVPALNATALPELARTLGVTPTFAPGYDLWVIDASTEVAPSKHQIVFPFPKNKWLQMIREGEIREGSSYNPASILVHKVIIGCEVSENIGPMPIWSSMEEESDLFSDRYEFIKTYRGEEGELLFQIIMLPTAEIRIEYSSGRQRECQMDAFAVVSQYIIVDILESMYP